MLGKRPFLNVHLLVVSGVFLFGACQESSLNPAGDVLGLQSPSTSGPATQDNRGLPEMEVPFRLNATAMLLGQDFAPDFGPPTFGKSDFEGRCSQPADFVIQFAMDGDATHLGHVAATAEHCTVINFQTGFATEIDGVMVIMAADGDELHAQYSGVSPPGPGFEEDYEFVGGTGRFDGAAGSGEGSGACNQQTGTCDFVLEGAIAYDASQGSD